MATNYGSGKNSGGSIPGHDSPENFGKLSVKKEPEFAGVYRSAPNPKPAVQSGSTDSRDGKEQGRSFDLLSPSYAGPQRIGQMNAGASASVVNPDSIQKG